MFKELGTRANNKWSQNPSVMPSKVWCRWCIFKEFPHLKWYCIFFFANFCHQAFKSGFHWSIWHYWYDCTGIIGMIVLCVAFVCSAKGGCETQPAAHLDNDMKHNILHIFMHSASVKCILCLKMHYLSYKIEPQSFFSKEKKYLEWLF